MAGPPTLRTTPALVEGIIQVETGIDVTPFIYIANSLTTSICSYSDALPPKIPFPYTDGFVNSQMELIERWLSAHFYTVFDNQLEAAKAGTAAVRFQAKIDYGLKTSMYGQNAMRLDYLGGLAQVDNLANVKRKIKVGGWWMGQRCRFPGDVFGDFWADLTIES